MATPTFFTVEADYKSVVGDSDTDLDSDPELGPVTATVTFTPMIKDGDVILATTMTPRPTGFVAAPIPARIDTDGRLKVRVDPDKDVLPFANLAAFPGTGNTAKLYLAQDTQIAYYWSGSAYVVTDNYVPVRLLADTVLLELGGDLWYTVSFTNVQYNGKKGQINSFAFQAPNTDTVINLITVTPGPGQLAAGVTKIAPGGARRVGNTIVFTFAGVDIPDPIDISDLSGEAWADIPDKPAPLVAGPNVANGYAGLDGSGKIGTAQLPISAMEYKGNWNVSTNSPTLADGTGSAGDVYKVATGAARNLGSGSITWDIGDYAIYNGSTWEKSDTTDAIASVAGLTGVITAAALKTAIGLDHTVAVVFYAGDLNAARPTADAVYWVDFPSTPTNALSQDFLTDTSTLISSKTIDNTNTINVKDTLLTVQDATDTTKRAKLDVPTGQTTSTTRTHTLPAVDSTLASLDGTEVLTHKSMDGASNVFTNLPASATPNVARLVCTTAVGASGTEDGANTWAHIATMYASTSGDSTLAFAIMSGAASTGGDLAIVSVSVRGAANGSPPTVTVNMSAKAGASSLITSDSVKVVAANASGGTSTAEVWFKKGASFGQIKFFEIGRNVGGAVPVYYDGAPWQSAVPTGTAVNVSSAGVTVFGAPVATTTGTETHTNKTLTAPKISGGSGTANISAGTGSPEGVVTATVGSIYLRTDGGTATTVYIKESGSGNTGWVVAGTGIGSSGTPPDIQTFTANGTWTKPAGSPKVTQYFLVGPSGGGGAGAREPSGTASCGGAGGGAGGITEGLIDTSLLTATVAVTVPAGGAGAAAQTTDGTAGAAGSPGGGSTTFGSYALAGRGLGGAGGGAGVAATGGTGGVGTAIGSTGGASAANGSSGGGSANAACTGGGGGGGVSTVPTASGGAAAGTSVGGTGGTGGAIQGGAGTAGTATTNYGIGGGGGAGATAAAGGAGGAGTIPGGGGGGGGASLNGNASGAGGAGARGLAVIVTWF